MRRSSRDPPRLSVLRPWSTVPGFVDGKADEAMKIKHAWALLISLLATSVLGTPATSAATATRTFTTEADAYVSASSPSKNYGTATSLRVDGSPVQRSYVRFTVAGISSPVVRATLRVYATHALSSGLAAHTVAVNSWGEKTLTWANAPAPAATVVGSSAGFSSGWVTINVTSAVTGNGTFTLVITNPSSTAVSLRSREAGASTAPQLLVETSVTPPTTTSDPVVAAAGDIACTTAAVTSGSACHYGLTASVITSDPSITDVLTLGDLQYECGDYANFLRFYDPTWGLFRARTHPAIGNHEYLAAPTSGCAAASTVPAQGYFDYWNGVGVASGPAGSRDGGYHSFNVGSWHLIALNSNCSKAGGCGATSPQATWLRNDLAAHPTACTLAYWHHPLFSSGEHGNNSSVAPFWDILQGAGVEVVLNGHDHDYERFTPQTAAGVAAPTTGIREFVVGTGGKSHYTFTAVKPNSAVRNGDTFGVLKLTLHPQGYDWRFAPEAGKTFTDAGSDTCH
jgi:hypothetical protein